MSYHLYSVLLHTPHPQEIRAARQAGHVRAAPSKPYFLVLAVLQTELHAHLIERIIHEELLTALNLHKPSRNKTIGQVPEPRVCFFKVKRVRLHRRHGVLLLETLASLLVSSLNE